MFHSEFFPTPAHVIDAMGIDCRNRIVLEPSAGKGDIVRWLRNNGATRVLACETNQELRHILAGSGQCEIVAEDFFKLTAGDVPHINQIVMNPPFSNGVLHILHAWEIAPEGCEIIALCNYSNIERDGYGKDRELRAIIKDYGDSMNMGPVFGSDAERTTNVEVGLIRLFKPMVTERPEFEDFYTTDDNDHGGQNGIIAFDEIKAVVNTYISAVRVFEKVEAAGKELATFTNVSFMDQKGEAHKLSYGSGVSFGAYNRDGISTKDQFARGYQAQCWSYIFDRVGIRKHVTSGVLKDVTRYIESQKNYPFTVRNIYKMLDVIVGTRAQTMQRAIVEAIDNFTRHTHENRYGIEGWKTNEGHLLGKKFIIEGFVESDWSGGLRNSGRNSDIHDLIKAMCFVTAKDFTTIPDIDSTKEVLERRANGYVRNGFVTNRWYDWGFFEFKVFKKGTGHFKFKSESDWQQLNQAYAKAKGMVLPEKI